MNEPSLRTTFILNGYRTDVTLSVAPDAERDETWLQAVMTGAHIWRTSWRWGEKVMLMATEHNIVEASTGEEGQCLD